MSYSLTEAVTDGPLEAPRWVHHAIKIVTACVATLALIACRVPLLWAAVLGGYGVWLLTVVKERLWPSDPTVYSLWLHLADWLTDSALAGVPVTVVLWNTLHPRAALALLVEQLVAYVCCHRGARP